MKMATLDVRGMKESATIEMIEILMEENDFYSLAIQETRITTTHQERRKNYTWHFQDEQEPEKQVAILQAQVSYLTTHTNKT